MDLIYMNEQKEDIGVLMDYTFDLAYGCDENDFELTVRINNHVCKEKNIIYIENTEFGGMIDRIRIKTASDKLVYIGRTWHGILSTKIFEPDAGEDYLVCNGEANEVIDSLILRIGLSDLFIASSKSSNLILNNYKMHRYINGYEGIKKMLASVGGKLKVNFQNGFAVLSAEPLIDYSQDDEFDSSQIDFEIEKNFKPINHVICLGRGDLAEREVIHLYADLEGNISYGQTQIGLDEVTATYENANTESSEELEKGGVELLEESWNSDSLQVNFDGTSIYDIGDIVGARENITGITIAKAIAKKIVTINRNGVKITHKVGD